MNLVLIQAFPATRQLSVGVIAFFEQLGFTVYFIEFPGFGVEQKFLGDITEKSILAHIQERLNTLNLDSYILGGLSIGCRFACSLPVDEKCKGMLLLEPCLSARDLLGSRLYFSALKLFFAVLFYANVYQSLFRSSIFRMYLHNVSGNLYPDFAHIVQNTINPYAFFKLAQVILYTRPLDHLPDVPFVVAVNPTNAVLNVAHLEDCFRNCSERVTYLHIPISHNAATLQYYNRVVTPEHKQRIVNIFRSY